MPIATLDDGRTVEYLPEIIGSGAMKVVYLSKDKQSVVAFYRGAGVSEDPYRMARLRAVLNQYNITRDPKHGEEFSRVLCWITGIIVQPKLGVVMPIYPSNFFFGSGARKGLEKISKWFTSNTCRQLLEPKERGTLLDHLRVAMLVSRSIRKLHMSGLAHTDISDNNVLADPTCHAGGGDASARCMLVTDIDGLAVEGIYHPDVDGTPGYVAPEVLAHRHLPLRDPKRVLPSILTDLHSLPVLIYEFLLNRHPLFGRKIHAADPDEDDFLILGEKALFIENPHDTSNASEDDLLVKCDRLGPHLKTLFDKAFIDGLHNPARRPIAGEWEHGLYLTTNIMHPCSGSSCPSKWFIYLRGEEPRCPWCGWTLRFPTPVLDFYRPLGQGQLLPDGNSLLCFNGRTVHAWHVDTRVRPIEGADRTVQARVTYDVGRRCWTLVNERLDSMTVVSPVRRSVPPGQSADLEKGMRIVLAQTSTGRMVEVNMIP